MIRHWRPVSFFLFTAIGAVLIYSAYATPMPTPPTATVPTTPQIVYATREVVVTATPSPLARISAESMTATAEAQPQVDYTPPPPTAATDCFWSPGREYCTWTTPVPAPTTAPLEGFGH